MARAFRVSKDASTIDQLKEAGVIKEFDTARILEVLDEVGVFNDRTRPAFSTN